MFENFTLSKTDTNIIYIPIGNMPPRKADEYIQRLSEELTDYPVCLVAVPSDYSEIDEATIQLNVEMKLKQLGIDYE